MGKAVEEVQRTPKRGKGCLTSFYTVSTHFGAVLSINFIDFSDFFWNFPLKWLFLTKWGFEDEKDGKITIKRLKTIEKHQKQLQASFRTLCAWLNWFLSPLCTKKSEISHIFKKSEAKIRSKPKQKKNFKHEEMSQTGPETREKS